MIPLSQTPVSLVEVCDTIVKFFQVTVVPTLIFSVVGLKVKVPFLVMILTVFLCLASGTAAAAECACWLNPLLAANACEALETTNDITRVRTSRNTPIPPSANFNRCVATVIGCASNRCKYRYTAIDVPQQ